MKSFLTPSQFVRAAIVLTASAICYAIDRTLCICTSSTGDFVLTAEQVNPVRSALVSHGIEVTALHQHLVGGDPTLYFMHFWAAAAPQSVLSGLRAALDVVRQAS